MLPTPDTSHVPYERVYEPAEDSFLLLDTLSSPSETAFLHSRFNNVSTSTPTSKTKYEATPPLVIEIGPGSGVVIAFLTAHASKIFGRRHIISGAVDINKHACAATTETVRKAVSEPEHDRDKNTTASSMAFIGAVQGDLAAPLRDGSVDVLIFNPPYVPTAELPSREEYGGGGGDGTARTTTAEESSYEEDSYLLALSYAGGKDGMEITDRLLDSLPGVLSERGCAYILLCAQNKPEEVRERVRGLGVRGGGDEGEKWKVETVGSSGKQAGWERLQIIRIWREL
jgi:release factor glutamine methyltransferase